MISQRTRYDHEISWLTEKLERVIKETPKKKKQIEHIKRQIKEIEIKIVFLN